MELANCIAQKGANVTVIGTQAAPMQHVMGEKVGRIFQKLLEKSGVKFQMNAEVQKLTVDGDVRYVHIKGAKEPLRADVVVVGTGVKPGTEPLAGAVDLLEDGSVKVDKHYQIEGAVDAYAIGDIATFPYWGPGSGQGGGKTTTRIEHWDVAQNQGRAAADHIIHQDKGSKVDLPPKRFVPVFWSALGAQLRYCGTTINGYDGVVLKGDPDNAKFVAYYTLGEVVVAVASMQSDPVVMKCVNLMKAGKMPGKTAIKDGVDVLKIEV
ncbi:hypothetical protein KEM55_007875 [Ascosphaera atra]|nr:hypothetical protein KEM55_007875 [Ascosphaera atra]